MVHPFPITAFSVSAVLFAKGVTHWPSRHESSQLLIGSEVTHAIIGVAASDARDEKYWRHVVMQVTTAQRLAVPWQPWCATGSRDADQRDVVSFGRFCMGPPLANHAWVTDVKLPRPVSCETSRGVSGVVHSAWRRPPVVIPEDEEGRLAA